MKAGSRVLLGYLFLVMLVTSARAAGPVVVELFTAEGCSSCPPADALLAEISGKIADGAEIIALGEHVDYWNDLGWKDRFSSSQLTERQKQYVAWLHLQTAYTPQMIIDGSVEVLGNDRGAVAKDLMVAVAKAKPATVALKWEAPGKLHVVSQAPESPGLDVVLAITEDALTTSITGGENKGKVLQHAAVVRELRVLGKTSHGSFDKTSDVALRHDWNPSHLKAVVFVQNPHHGEIMGAAELPFQPSPTP